MMVVMERTQAFMSHNLESKSLRDPLNGQVAKLLKFILFHNYSLFSFHYSLAKRPDTPLSWCRVPSAQNTR